MARRSEILGLLSSGRVLRARVLRAASGLSVAALPLLYTGIAAAHIDLLEPTSRYPIEVSHENKSCPCGMGTSNRSCNVPAERSDANRAMDRVSTFDVGTTIQVTFKEYVGHSGRFRIAFDKEGADLDDFNARILMDVADPPGNVGNTGNGSNWTFDVKLPDEPCSNCTLQLIQMMDGNMLDPVPNPVNRSSYYQCADVVLVDPNAPAVGSDADDGGGCSISNAGALSARSGQAGALLALFTAGALLRRRALPCT